MNKKYKKIWNKYNEAKEVTAEVVSSLIAFAVIIALAIIGVIVFPPLLVFFNDEISAEFYLLIVGLFLSLITLVFSSVVKKIRKNKFQNSDIANTETLQELYDFVFAIDPNIEYDTDKIIVAYNNSKLNIHHIHNNFECILFINDKQVDQRFFTSVDICQVIKDFYHEKFNVSQEIVVFDNWIKNLQNNTLTYVDEFGRLHTLDLQECAKVANEKYNLRFEKNVVCLQVEKDEFVFCTANTKVKIVFNNKSYNKMTAPFLFGKKQERIQKLKNLLKDSGFCVFDMTNNV